MKINILQNHYLITIVVCDIILIKLKAFILSIYRLVESKLIYKKENKTENLN